MYLKRKVDSFLNEWKADPDRKPLIIKGSRQVGKTESIKHFAAEYYESIIEINFVRDEKYKGIIADGYEAADTPIFAMDLSSQRIISVIRMAYTHSRISARFC